MKKEYAFDKKDVHYILKGWVSDKAKYIKVPHCPWFDSKAEAKEFYALNKEYDHFYMWTKFKDLSVFKMYPRPDDELVDVI